MPDFTFDNGVVVRGIPKDISDSDFFDWGEKARKANRGDVLTYTAPVSRALGVAPTIEPPPLDVLSDPESLTELPKAFLEGVFPLTNELAAGFSNLGMPINEAIALDEAKTSAYARRHPGMVSSLNAAGAVAAGFIPGYGELVAAERATPLARAGINAALGAAASGQGDAGGGALIGALTGEAGAQAYRGLSRLKLNRDLNKLAKDNPKAVGDVALHDVMTSGGGTVSEARENAKRFGPMATVADVAADPRRSSLLSQIISAASPERAGGIDLWATGIRGEARPERVPQLLEGILGYSQKDAENFIPTIRARMKSDAAKNYEALENTVIGETDDLRTFMKENPYVADAQKPAEKQMRSLKSLDTQGKMPPVYESSSEEAPLTMYEDLPGGFDAANWTALLDGVFGDVVVEGEGKKQVRITPKYLQVLKGKLDDRISESKNDIGSLSQEAQHLIEVRNRLVKLMDDAVPGWEDARLSYANDADLQRAAKMGRTTFERMSPADVREYFKGLSGPEKEAFRIGAAESTFQKSKNIKSEDSKILTELTSLNEQEKFNEVFGGAKRKQLQDLIDRENQFIRTERAVGEGRKQAADRVMNAGLSGGKTKGLLGGLGEGVRFYSATGAQYWALETLLDMALRKDPMAQEAVDSLAKRLLQTDGNMPTLIKEIEKSALGFKDKKKMLEAVREGNNADFRRRTGMPIATTMSREMTR